MDATKPQTPTFEEIITEVYLSAQHKRREINEELQKLLTSQGTNGIKMLEEKLTFVAQNGKESGEIGYAVLGLAHLYAEEGNYNQALELLSRHREYAVKVAETNEYSGILYVALLESAIYKNLEKQQQQTILRKAQDNKRVWSDYVLYVQTQYLTPELEHLMMEKSAI